MNASKSSDHRETEDLAQADKIDLICDAFERAWLNGEIPRIEDYLDRSDSDSREQLLVELLLVDREFRIKRGEHASRDAYRERFPDYSTAIDGVEFPTIDNRVTQSAASPPPRPAVRLGGKLAQFELLEQLGAGASGMVWKARDTRLRRFVAVKIPRHETFSAAERERFLREGQASAQLRHPHIVAVHEVGEELGRAFIVTEFIEGLTLRNWLRQRRPQPRESAQLAAELAEALHHAHEQGIIHRDLKPANVLMDREDKPHITDFGLAKWVADSAHFTVDGHILGTPAYMSPEQARGEASQVDRRSDVYGLGAVLYEMLTGCPPFEGDMATIVHQVIHNEPRPPRKLNPAIPRDLETICLKAMEKDRNRRYPSTQEMAVDLHRLLRGDPILGRRSSLVVKSWRWLRRRPAVAALLLMILICAGALSMVNALARENKELLGLQMVHIDTNPPGAKVAFVPLSETTGKPFKSEVKYGANLTPLSKELKPGDYLVVAVLPDGRFHEVLRHVPKANETIPFSYPHQRWRREEDGTIQLPAIVIPDDSVTKEMAFVDGDKQFQLGQPGDANLRPHKIEIAPFFIDCHEFTYGDYRQHIEKGARLNRDKMEAPEMAMPVTFDMAVAYAESLGKRLPTEAEYEFAATVRGKFDYPWGNEFPEYRAANFGPVGQPAFDVLPLDRQVYGLCTNVAEWTSSWPVPYPPYSSVDDPTITAELRVFRGGSMATMTGNPDCTKNERNPRQRNRLKRTVQQPGIGFRCVRSATPLIPFEEIP